MFFGGERGDVIGVNGIVIIFVDVVKVDYVNDGFGVINVFCFGGFF